MGVYKGLKQFCIITEKKGSGLRSLQWKNNLNKIASFFKKKNLFVLSVR